MPVSLFQKQLQLLEEFLFSFCEIFNFHFLKFVATLSQKKIAFFSFLGEFFFLRVNYGTFGI